jgi:hypothetical protein
MGERIFAICVAAAFGFLPYAVKGMPNFIAWIGIAGAVVIGGLTFTSINPRLVMPAGFMIATLLAFVAASAWLYQRYQETPRAFPDAVARLAEMGWTVKPSQEDILFEINGGSLPAMQESATYFAQLHKPFRLHFQSVKSLGGLHYLSGISDCTNIEINAGEFTDVSELQGFTNLTKLVISQVPLNGVGVVDASPLASLINLQELVLGMTRIRDADFLVSLTKLKRLYIGQTLISDISPVSALSSLEYLDIRGTRITDLRPLDKTDTLSELMIGGEQVPGLASLRNLPIKKMTLIEQQPVDLAPIGAMTNLESFFGWGPPQIDIAQLHNLSKLQNLTLTGMGIVSLSSVANPQMIGDFTELKTLTLGQLAISDLSFIGRLKNLVEINLNRLPTTSIASFAGLTDIKKLSFVDVPLVDISALLQLPKLVDVNFIRVPARSDILTELERRGVRVTRY